ncbi:MAG: 16S rRNA (guanine(527)-N(7))-methyltransferase RsmG [Chloroflexota bacterium]
MDDHVRLLLAWTEAINLTAIRDPAAVARLHVIDSLAAVPVLRDARLDGFIDLGSGGGFPGLPLAAALPDVSALLVDSVAKKVRFVDAAIGATGLAARVSANAARAESLAQRPRHRERWPAVTARAVASLADIVELSFPLLRIGGRVIAWKTVAAEGEMAAASRAVDALGGGRVRVIDVRASGLEGHRLVVVTKAGRTSASYPRDPAERRRRPW